MSTVTSSKIRDFAVNDADEVKNALAMHNVAVKEKANMSRYGNVDLLVNENFGINVQKNEVSVLCDSYEGAKVGSFDFNNDVSKASNFVKAAVVGYRQALQVQQDGLGVVGCTFDQATSIIHISAEG